MTQSKMYKSTIMDTHIKLIVNLLIFLHLICVESVGVQFILQFILIYSSGCPIYSQFILHRTSLRG